MYSQAKVLELDRRHMEVLGIRIGETLIWNEAIERIREKTSLEKFDSTIIRIGMSSIKNIIENTIKDFDSAFCINKSQPWHNIANKVNIFIFNIKSDYENYLKELTIGYQVNSGLTLQSRGSDVHVCFYLQVMSSMTHIKL